MQQLRYYVSPGIIFTLAMMSLLIGCVPTGDSEIIKMKLGLSSPEKLTYRPKRAPSENPSAQEVNQDLTDNTMLENHDDISKLLHEEGVKPANYLHDSTHDINNLAANNYPVLMDVPPIEKWDKEKSHKEFHEMENTKNLMHQEEENKEEENDDEKMMHIMGHEEQISHAAPSKHHNSSIKKKPYFHPVEPSHDPFPLSEIIEKEQVTHLRMPKKSVAPSGYTKNKLKLSRYGYVRSYRKI